MRRHHSPSSPAYVGTRLPSLVRTALLGCGLALCGAAASAAPFPADAELTIENATQQISLLPQPDGRLTLSTAVRGEGGWTPLFDAGQPLLIGSNFDLQATTGSVQRAADGSQTLRFGGRRTQPDYPWHATVTMQPDDPWATFTIVCDLPQVMMLPDAQPTIALWINQSTVTLTLDQGPASQLGNVYRTPYNFGFPAAYLWDAGREACLFLDVTPMTWFSPWGLHRFMNVQVKTQARDGRIGLGMHTRSLSGDRITSGPMVSRFHLYAAARARQPDKSTVLAEMLQRSEPLLPADSDFPSDTLNGGEVSWTTFSQRIIRDMLIPGATMAEHQLPWSDQPLDLVAYPDTMLVHPDMMKKDPALVASQWNSSSNNHHLAPWILLGRTDGDPETLRTGAVKLAAVPRYYDPPSRTIRSYPPMDPPAMPLELSWQTLVFYQTMLKLDGVQADAGFNPAVAGRLLMGLEGLIEYARKLDYSFSTYYNPLTKEPLPFLEHPPLGDVREPWSVGSYAQVLMQAHAITGEARYRDEALHALKYFMHDLKLTESNEEFTRHYSERMEIPVSDLVGNAYGAVGAFELWKQTNDPEMLTLSRDFLNVLLRLALWHGDQGDAVSRELRIEGLFYPFVGAACATPWETTEANICLAWLLEHDRENPLTPLLLKLSNLNRINSFYFYPAVYGPATRAMNPQLRRDVGQYFPIEPLYQLESMGGSVGGDGTALYMAGNGLWNAWMYEALAEASDRRIMVLNPRTLDQYEEALTAAQRPLIVYNPTAQQQRFLLHVKALPAGEYTVTRRLASGDEIVGTYPAEALQQGLEIELAPLAGDHLLVSRADGGASLAAIQSARAARNQLSHVYSTLQLAATAQPQTPQQARATEQSWQALVQTYAAGDYARVESMGQTLLSARD